MQQIVSCIDPRLLDAVSSVITLSGNSLRVLHWVGGVSQKARSNTHHKIFIVNETHIYLLNMKAFTKTVVITHQMPWFEVRRIVYTSDSTLSFYSDEDVIRFASLEISEFLPIIIQTIHNLFTQTEMPEVDLAAFDYSVIYHMPAAAFSRLRTKMMLHGDAIPPDLSSALLLFFVSCPRSIDVCKFDSTGAYIPYILDAINIEPRITSVFMKQTTIGPMWTELANFLETNTTITKVIVQDDITADFLTISQALKSNHRSKVEEFGFKNSHISLKQVSMLTTVFSEKPLKRLSFQSSLTGESLTTFLMEVRGNAAFWSLEVLRLDSCKGMDLFQLIRTSMNLKSLSIANCSIELADLFTLLNDNPECQLESINISGNSTQKPLDVTLTLPSKLQKIKAQSMIFDNDSFLRLFKILLKQPCFVDVSKTIMRSVDWERVLKSLGNVNAENLLGIGWSKNPLCLHFFAFLDKCSNLMKLKLDSCFEENESFIGEFVNFVETSSTLKFLKMRKNPNPLKLLHPLILNRSIEAIDVSGHYIDQVGINIISQILMANRIVKVVNFSLRGIGIEKIIEFFGALSERGVPLELPWPGEDITDTFSRTSYSESDLRTIIALHKKVTTGDKSIEIPGICLCVNPEELPMRIQHTAEELQNEVIIEPAFSLDREHVADDINSICQMQEARKIAATSQNDNSEWDILQPLVPKPDDSDYFAGMEAMYGFAAIRAYMNKHR